MKNNGIFIDSALEEFYSLILHPVAREIKFNHLATSRNHWWLLKNTGIFTSSTLLFPVATACVMHIYGSV
jgi:hypothetical protein